MWAQTSTRMIMCLTTLLKTPPLQGGRSLSKVGTLMGAGLRVLTRVEGFHFAQGLAGIHKHYPSASSRPSAEQAGGQLGPCLEFGAPPECSPPG